GWASCPSAAIFARGLFAFTSKVGINSHRSVEAIGNQRYRVIESSNQREEILTKPAPVPHSRLD
ncbi:MAG TPA: hypothetical protein DCZ55_21195, partial [Cyanobacteria bacterium UBA11371]|nr:hypothetical protein [Cyanobacteria bacterium UBA11371]